MNRANATHTATRDSLRTRTERGAHIEKPDAPVLLMEQDYGRIRPALEYMARGEGAPILVYRRIGRRDFVLVGRARFVLYLQFPLPIRDRRVFSNLARRLFLLLFRVRGGVVCRNCWLAFCVCIGLLALVFVLLARGFRLSKLLGSVWCWYWAFGGRSVCAVVAFRFPFGRRLSLVDPVGIWPKSAQFES